MKLVNKAAILRGLTLFLVMGIAGCDDNSGPTTPNGDTYTVAASSNPAAGGTTAGGGGYDAESSVTVVATPNAG